MGNHFNGNSSAQRMEIIQNQKRDNAAELDVKEQVKKLQKPNRPST